MICSPHALCSCASIWFSLSCICTHTCHNWTWLRQLLSLKHRKNCEKLPWELVGCLGVKVLLLKDVTILFFRFAQFEFLSLVTIRSLKVLSKFVCFFSFITVWVLEFCYNLGFFLFCHSLIFFGFVNVWVFLVLSQLGLFSFVTIWVFKFCRNFLFLVLS